MAIDAGRGLIIGALVLAAFLVMLALFVGGYYYLVHRNHQADEVDSSHGPTSPGG